MQKIVVKVGSSILTKKNGFLNEKTIPDLISDICRIKKEQDLQIVLVSSGAVSTGRYTKALRDFEVNPEAIKYDKNILNEQILAAVGQPRLMAFYISQFDRYQTDCAQLLATRADLADRASYLSLRTVTNNLLRAGIVPIFNENDVLSPEELDFSDNDQLACMIAAMIKADKLILLTDIQGLYDRSPKDPNAKLIPEVKKAADVLRLVDESSGTGKGGMRSKLLSADLITSLGISMHIASGFEKNILSKILNGKPVGTFFPAQEIRKKPLRNWLATCAVSEGKIIVSTFLADILRHKKTASILFSGIEDIQGDFEKKEVVEICDDSGCVLGRGLSRFDSGELSQKVSEYKRKNSRDKARTKTNNIIAVHYDYFVFA